MKRLILSLAAAIAVAGPIVGVASSAAADPHGHRGEHHGRWDRGDRHGGRWDRDHDRGGRWERNHDRGRWDRDDRRGRRADNWDRGHHNGYYYNNRWSYGPPPQAYYGNPYYRPGYAAWRRGSQLPPYYRGYVVSDYGRYRLRPPPRGYAWYRVDDDYLLASLTTGLIFDIIGD